MPSLYHLLSCGCMFLGMMSLTRADERMEEPWQDLMNPELFRKFDDRWIKTNELQLDPMNPRKFLATPAEGGKIWVNGPGRVANLETKKDYSDCEVEIEFMITAGSNSGIKFHSLYEIQILDTFGKDLSKLTGNSMGGIYPKAKNGPPYGYLDSGIPPKVNAAKKAGEWNKLTATWQAPRFDAVGTMTAPGVLIKAVLNDQVIHENVEILHPTGANHVRPNTAKGPFMLQADHGPTAIRSLKIRPKK